MEPAKILRGLASEIVGSKKFFINQNYTVMKTFIPTREELSETVRQAVEQAVSRRLPKLIKKATRKDYYTIQEVCDMLDVSRRHLQYLRDSGQLSYVKSGRKIYFKAEDLEQFFEQNYIKAQIDKKGQDK